MFTVLATQQAALVFAQTAPAVPVSPDAVMIPWGEMFAAGAQYIALLLIAALSWSYRFLPARIRDLMLTMQVEQLLQKAIMFGVNNVAGAVKDKTMSVEVSNRVLREALTYALFHGGEIAKRFAGSPDQLAEKIWARMPVAENVGKPDFATIATQAVLKVPPNIEPKEPSA